MFSYHWNKYIYIIYICIYVYILTNVLSNMHIRNCTCNWVNHHQDRCLRSSRNIEKTISLQRSHMSHCHLHDDVYGVSPHVLQHNVHSLGHAMACPSNRWRNKQPKMASTTSVGSGDCKCHSLLHKTSLDGTLKGWSLESRSIRVSWEITIKHGGLIWFNMV